MGVEENKAQAGRFLDEVINKGNMSYLDTFLGDPFVDHQTPPGMPPGKEGLKAFMSAFRAAFPDLHYTTKDTIAEGDRVVSRAQATGTMKGDFMGMPASGKSATWEEIHITRFANGKAVEHWGVVDQVGMFMQLGFSQLPAPPVGAAR
jgi:steroid delta-isomerase-like uncharacterized protein